MLSFNYHFGLVSTRSNHKRSVRTASVGMAVALIASFGVNTIVTPAATAAGTTASITAFTVPGQTGASEIYGTTVYITVPFEKNRTALAPTFTLSSPGASASVGGVAQISGTTTNNFTSPVTYTVMAADGTTQSWTVTIANAAAITGFTVPGQTKAATSFNGLSAVATIAITVPSGTNLTALAPTFTLSSSGASITVGGVVQISGTTTNNFTSPVIYTVTAANGTTQVWTVTIRSAVSANTGTTGLPAAITDFTVLGREASRISAADHTVVVTVPFGTNLSALAPTFALSLTGASATVGGVVQISGTTTNNFNSPLIYTITAVDGTAQFWTVTITIADSVNPNTVAIPATITDFKLPGLVTARIKVAERTVAVTVPFGTNLSSLSPTFTLSSSSASATVGGVVQLSGTTINNFASPVIYTITAADGTSQVWTVSITIAADVLPATIIAFTVPGQTQRSRIDVIAHTVAVTVPFGFSRSALSPTFTLSSSSASATVGGVVQISGTTTNNFTSPVIYTITAANGTTQVWTVTITNAVAITAFTVFNWVDSKIFQNESTIFVKVPYGTNLTELAPTFTFSSPGASASVSGVAQVSGKTINNFATPVMYTVTAADGTTRFWTVTITSITVPVHAAITSFSVPGQTGISAIYDNSAEVFVTVPFGTILTALAPTFTLSNDGASTTVGSVTQVSGITTNNYIKPVFYTVTASDGPPSVWRVTIITERAITPITLPSPLSFTSFTVLGQRGASNIVDKSSNIFITVPRGTNFTVLVPTFTLSSSSASATVGGVIQVSGTQINKIFSHHFFESVTYIVHGEFGETRVWTVTLIEDARGIPAEFTSVTVPGQVTPGGILDHSVAFIDVPFTTNRTALAATFTLSSSSASATVGGVIQVSGITTNDFTSPVFYTITALDGETQVWTVIVITSVAITSFSVPGQTGKTNIVNYGSVYIRFPEGTSRTALAATFTLPSGASATVGGVTQISATTINDFTSPVIYTVTAPDGTTKNWTVFVQVAHDKEKAAKEKAAKEKAAKEKAKVKKP